MRLGSFDAGDGPRAGALTSDGIVDLGDVLGTPVRDIADLCTLVGADVSSLQAAIANRTDARRHRPGAVRLLPPVLRPPTIRDHIAFEEHATKQFTRTVPDVWRRRPVHYYSNPSRLFGHGAEVPLPATERMDYELEIAAVIGSEISDADESNAMDAVLGFTLFDDFSARDLQMDEMAYGLGPCKGKDFASALGPWVVTTDELVPWLHEGVLDVRCRVRVNGQIWADSSAVHQFHSWESMIVHASQDSVLLPGDVIASGTVGGCSIGEALRKGVPGARYLQPGDTVELDVDHIGVLANRIVASRRAGEAPYRAHALPEMPTAVAGARAS